MLKPGSGKYFSYELPGSDFAAGIIHFAADMLKIGILATKERTDMPLWRKLHPNLTRGLNWQGIATVSFSDFMDINI